MNPPNENAEEKQSFASAKGSPSLTFPLCSEKRSPMQAKKCRGGKFFNLPAR